MNETSESAEKTERRRMCAGKHTHAEEWRLCELLWSESRNQYNTETFQNSISNGFKEGEKEGEVSGVKGDEVKDSLKQQN